MFHSLLSRVQAFPEGPGIDFFDPDFVSIRIETAPLLFFKYYCFFGNFLKFNLGFSWDIFLRETCSHFQLQNCLRLGKKQCGGCTFSGGLKQSQRCGFQDAYA